MEEEADRKAIRSPVIRVLGMVLLLLAALGVYIAADRGDIALVLYCGATFVVLVPPVVFGKFPFRALDKLNQFTAEFHKDPQAAINSLSRRQLQLIQAVAICWIAIIIYSLIS